VEEDHRKAKGVVINESLEIIMKMNITEMKGMKEENVISAQSGEESLRGEEGKMAKNEDIKAAWRKKIEAAKAKRIMVSGRKRANSRIMNAKDNGAQRSQCEARERRGG